jgi:hypothetical protein
LYFDGRFLAARDLTRDQDYFLVRQSDLARAGGMGVVNGLFVTVPAAGAPLGSTGSVLRITPGNGVTPSGELVVLPEAVTLDLTNVPLSERLDAAFGLSHHPHVTPHNRTGIYLLGLRAVEYTANPIASYPTSVTGPRTVEDGDIVEAVAVTLIPYSDEGTGLSSHRQRSLIAHHLFVQGNGVGAPVSVLPLAMLGLERGIIRWIDPFLVRREVGVEYDDVLSLGLATRAQREAHLQQYTVQLNELLAQATIAKRGFTASDYFTAIPPGGPMPASGINAAEFTQTFFPPEVDV